MWETLTSYNGRMVLAGTAILGVSAGVVGTFMMLRKRSLIGDVVGHAAVPGLAVAYLIGEWRQPGGGQHLPGLIAGAFAAGVAGAVCVLLIDRTTRLRSDAALAVVLAVFYGVGVSLLRIIQQVPSGSAAGLIDYLNGKSASLIGSDVTTFAAAAVVLLAVTLLLFKELTLLCFDADYAGSRGLPTGVLEVLLTGLVVGVTVLGMQSVGLILVVATLIIPPTAARFWTDDVRALTALAAVFGGLCSVAGVVLSSSAPKVPLGPVIVLCGTALFLASLLFGRRRGVVTEWVRRRRSAATPV